MGIRLSLFGICAAAAHSSKQAPEAANDDQRDRHHQANSKRVPVGACNARAAVIHELITRRIRKPAGLVCRESETGK